MNQEKAEPSLQDMGMSDINKDKETLHLASPRDENTEPSNNDTEMSNVNKEKDILDAPSGTVEKTIENIGSSNNKDGDVEMSHPDSGQQRGTKRGRSKDEPDSPHSESPPSKIIVALDDPAWQAQEQELYQVRERLQDSLKTLLQNKKTITSLEEANQSLKDEKKTLETALLGAKAESTSLLETTKSVQSAYAALLKKSSSGAVDSDETDMHTPTPAVNDVNSAIPVSQKDLLEKKIEELTVKVESQATQLQGMQSNLQKREEELQNLREELKRRNEEFTTIGPEDENLSSRTAPLQQEIEALRAEVESYKQKLTEVSGNLQQAEELNLQLQADWGEDADCRGKEINDLKLEIKNMEDTLTTKITELESKESEAENAKQEFGAQLKHIHDETNEQRQKLDMKIKNLESEKDALTTKIAQLATERLKEDEKRDLEAEIIRLKDACDESDQKRERSDQSAGALRQKLQTSNSELQELECQYNALKQQLEEQELKMQHLQEKERDDDANRQNEDDKNRETIKSLQTQNSALKISERQQAKVVEELREKLRDVEETSGTLTSQLTQSKSQVSQEVRARVELRKKMEKEVEGLEKRIKELKLQLQNEQGDQANTLSKLKEENTQLQTKLQDLTQQDESSRVLQEQIRVLKSAKVIQDTQVHDLEEENKMLKDRLDGEWVSKSRFDDARKELEKEESKVAALQRKLDVMSKNLTNKSSENSAKDGSTLEELAGLKQTNERLSAQIKALLTVPASSTSGSTIELQTEIERLKYSLSDADENFSRQKRILREAHEADVKELNAEIGKLKSKINRAASPDSEQSAAQMFATRRSTRMVLSKANVDHALREARRTYALKGKIERQDDDYTADSESDRSSSAKYPIGSKPKRKSPYILKTKRSKDTNPSNGKGKGKQRANYDAQSSSGTEDVWSEQDTESKTGQTREVYSRKGIHSSWNEKDQVIQSNRMVRAQFHEMLNIRQSIEAPRRPGIEQKDPERLTKFQQEPDKYGPGLRCTYLDTSGQNIDQLMDSDWNRLFILTLANECEFIAKGSRDPSRFAAMEWLKLARDRVYRALLEVARAKPQQGETKKEALARLMDRYIAKLADSKNVYSRHRKFEWRQQVAATMITVCKDRGNAGDAEAGTLGVAFWQWVLNLLNRAGHKFMSDEEDISVLDETSGSRPLSILAKQILVLKWRHPYFLKLFTFIDVTTGIEEMVFQRSGHQTMRRVRTQKFSTWPAPPGRPINFYSPVFMVSLPAPDKASLRMDQEEFVFRDFEGYLDD